MNVGIFETEHFEVAYPLVLLFDNSENNITVFTNNACYRQFRHLFNNRLEKYNWIIKEDKASKYHFIHRLYKEAKERKIDILILNTIKDNFIFYAMLILILPTVRIILTLHDINTFFEYRPSFSLRRLMRITGKKCLVAVTKEYNVIAFTMTSYLKTKLPDHKKVHCLPGAVFEEDQLKTKVQSFSDYITLVVPGTIDKRRRNYDFVFDLLNEANRRSLPLIVILLGCAYGEYGKEILKRCQVYAKERNNIKFYESKVIDQPEFDRVLNDAHFVFLPSVIHTIISDGISETYGISKSSGNISDIIKHAKPFFAPYSLNIDPFLEASCFRYNTVEEFIEHIENFLASPEKYSLAKQNAVLASRNYLVEKIRSRNKDLFQQ